MKTDEKVGKEITKQRKSDEPVCKRDHSIRGDMIYMFSYFTDNILGINE